MARAGVPVLGPRILTLLSDKALERRVVKLSMRDEPLLCLKGAQSASCTRTHMSVDGPRIVPVVCEHALGRGDAGGFRSVGLWRAAQSGGIWQPGQDLFVHHLLGLRNP